MSRATIEDLAGELAEVRDLEARRALCDAVADVLGDLLQLGTAARAAKGELVIRSLRAQARHATDLIEHERTGRWLELPEQVRRDIMLADDRT